MNKNIEIELKYAAAHVAPDAFKAKVRELFTDAAKIEHISMRRTLDTFYLMPNDVKIRHRRVSDKDNKGELTIKSRKSESSTLERKEIDLPVADNSNVPSFMEACKAKELFTLGKDYELFVIKYPEYSLDVVMYDAYRVKVDSLGEPFKTHAYSEVRFLEVEVHKDSLVSADEAMEIVGRVGRTISKALKLGAPLNASLFECFNTNVFPEKAVISYKRGFTLHSSGYIPTRDL